MFAKLLKYDMKSVKRFGVPILIGLAGATVLGIAALVGSILTFGAVAEVNPMIATLLSSLVSMLMMAVIFVLAVAGIGIQIAVYYDFYRSLVTDEAYLTFTLPVKPRQILGAKLLNDCIWQAIGGVAVTLSIFLLILAGFVADGTLVELWPFFSSIWHVLTRLPGGALLLLLLSLLLSVIYAVNSVLLYFMAIFFGSIIAKKHKLLSVIGCVFGANMIYGTVVQVVFTVLGFTAALTGPYILTTLNIIVAISILLLAGLSVLFFKLTEHMMQRKLNLA